MNNGDVVKFVYCNADQYSSIQNKDAATVYFVAGSTSADDTINIGSSVFIPGTSSLDSRITALETWKNSLVDGDSIGYGS